MKNNLPSNYARAVGNLTRLGLTAEQSTELLLFYQNWTSLYYRYVDPNQRNVAMTIQIRRNHP